MPQIAASTVKYCEEQVSQHDRERYLCIMLARKEKRHDLMALYAFNCEVTRIRDLVSKPVLGQIRLQWWRETIENCEPGKPRPSGIAGALFDTICTCRLRKQPFLALLDARSGDLDETPPPSMEALIDYCIATSSSLIQLSMDILQQDNNPDSGITMAARDCGVAWALTGIIRSVPFQASQGRCMLPTELMREAGIDGPNGLTGNHPPDTLRGVVNVLAVEAQTRIKSARAESRNLPRAVIPALLSVTLAAYYQKQIAKAHNDPFDRHLQHSHSPLKILALLYAAWRGKI